MKMKKEKTYTQRILVCLDKESMKKFNIARQGMGKSTFARVLIIRGMELKL